MESSVVSCFLRHSSFQRVSQGSTGLSVDKLVSFGTDHGDSVMQPADDAYIEIPLAKDPFIFVKTPYSNVFLNTNGFITMINGIKLRRMLNFLGNSDSITLIKCFQARFNSSLNADHSPCP